MSLLTLEDIKYDSNLRMYYSDLVRPKKLFNSSTDGSFSFVLWDSRLTPEDSLRSFSEFITALREYPIGRSMTLMNNRLVDNLKGDYRTVNFDATHLNCGLFYEGKRPIFHLRTGINVIDPLTDLMHTTMNRRRLSKELLRQILINNFNNI